MQTDKQEVLSLRPLKARIFDPSSTLIKHVIYLTIDHEDCQFKPQKGRLQGYHLHWDGSFNLEVPITQPKITVRLLSGERADDKTLLGEGAFKVEPIVRSSRWIELTLNGEKTSDLLMDIQPTIMNLKVETLALDSKLAKSQEPSSHGISSKNESQFGTLNVEGPSKQETFDPSKHSTSPDANVFVNKARDATNLPRDSDQVNDNTSHTKESNYELLSREESSICDSQQGMITRKKGRKSSMKKALEKVRKAFHLSVNTHKKGQKGEIKYSETEQKLIEENLVDIL